MASNWTVTLLITAVYVSLVIIGQRGMRGREPLRIQKLLIFWNWGLATFSVCGFIRGFPELYAVLSGRNGLYRSICVRDTLNPSSIFWAFLFTWSKVAELFDTAFLILRKKNISFLHLYHHCTVMIVCFATYADYDPILRWFGLTNFLVHFYMYSYFAIRAMNFNLPKSVSVTVTTFQLSQMVMGILVNCYAVWMKHQGIPCIRSTRGLIIHMTLYASYFVLFAQFFYKAYLGKKKLKSS